jgi:sigma-E factor negative regulatory protein RseA
MSEQFNEQISEFIDDELSAEECEFFVRRLQRDEASRGRYMRYQLIGAALRGEHVHPESAKDLAKLRGRLRRALDEPPQARFAGARGLSASHWAAGLGIAASVALAAILGLRLTGFEPELEAAVADAATPSYVVPPSNADTGQLISVPVRLTELQYLMHHGGFTSGLNRNLMHSSVVAGQESVADEGTEAAAQAASGQAPGSDSVD